MSPLTYQNPQEQRVARKVVDYLLILILLIVLLTAGFPRLIHKGAEKIFILRSEVVYENRDEQAVWNFSENDRTISLFMNNSWQTVNLISVSHPIEKLDYDSSGNKIAIINFTRASIGSGERIGYNLTFRFTFKQRSLPEISEDKSGVLDEIPEDLRRTYCEPTDLWQSNDLILKETALDIAGNETNVLSILEKFIKWIKLNIAYKSYEIPKYPNETLYERAGDCDDQANLLITFCRSLGIPAYLQVGCIYIPQYSRNLTYWSGHLMIRQSRVGWHGWAMVYIPPWSWLPVDLTYVSGDLSFKPLDAIKEAALIKHYTFQYTNITKGDYVAETRAFKEFLETYKFYIYEDDEINEITVKEDAGRRKIIILVTYAGCIFDLDDLFYKINVCE
ncbi:MAG: transglutaminase-like domain-containing protein [Candidatus Bathyarchaeia archaeon]|nr:transglutaminase domain-containing protein [Candidatus Bathyarchaeota archaeon]